LVEAAAEAFTELAATQGEQVLVNQDLHADNILSATREPWLVIDPKPLSGDPHHEVPPLLWNRWDEIAGARDLRFALRRRFYAIVDAAGLDEDRARDWVIVRMMVNAKGAIHDAGADDVLPKDWLTRNIAVTKAIQD
jgi:streptomycin 6-kinase